MAIVYIVTAVVFIIFAPLNFSGYAYFDKEAKRLSFSVYLYDAIKVFGGYAQLRKGSVIMHYGNKRAKMFAKSDMGNFKIKLKDLRRIQVFSSALTVSFPFSVNCVNAATLINCSTELLCPFIAAEKDFLSLRSTVIFGRDSDIKAYYKIKIGLNLFVVIRMLAG